jgi:hypothetical protein
MMMSPVDVLIFMGEDCQKIITQLSNNIHGTGEWPKDLIEVTVIALKKKPEATKCSYHCSISLITYAANIVARMLRKNIERKIVNIFYVFYTVH